MSKRTERLWRMLMDGAPPVDETVNISSADVNEQTRANMAGEPPKRVVGAFIAGRNRILGDHSVCTTCGAMVDNEFLAAHVTFHDTPGKQELVNMD